MSSAIELLEQKLLDYAQGPSKERALKTWRMLEVAEAQRDTQKFHLKKGEGAAEESDTDNSDEKDDEPANDKEIEEKAARARQQYLDSAALRLSGTEPSVGPNATPEEKEADRHRRLCALTTRHRQVFAKWPRDPRGEVIEPGDLNGLGKRAPNGIDVWGHSLLNFYKVQRFPDIPGVDISTTGSKLHAWMQEHGEYTRDHIGIAEEEPGPEEVNPWPIVEAFKDTDRRAQMWGKKSTKRKGDRIEFGLQEPFLSYAAAPTLQERVPLRQFPKTLVVHDPSRLLRAGYQPGDLANEPMGWNSRPDIVSVYHLQLSEEGQKTMEQEDNDLRKQQREEAKIMAEFLENPTTENMPATQGVLVCTEAQKAIGPSVPALFCTYVPAPIRDPIEESHMYLSPHHLIGKGTHSYAFNVDLEVPRSMVVPSYLCQACVVETGLAMAEEEDGPNGERRNPQWDERSGVVSELVDFFRGVSASNIPNEDGKEAAYDIIPPRRRTKKQYRGPVRVVHTGVEYQVPGSPVCKHLAKREQPAGLTANVAVVAKLAHPYHEDHLEREVEKYQEFPTHFFQHFTGLNQLPPLDDPFPVGALVPRFYGYYVPDDDFKPMVFDRNKLGSGLPGAVGREKWKEVGLQYGYRSPILLLENCGKPIPLNVNEMSIGDRETCASLFFRMHHAGWTHGSPYKRNVLMQSGPIDTYPLSRMVNEMNERRDLRGTTFRLIDFGKSEKFGDAGPNGGDKVEEEARVIEAFKLLHHSEDS